MDSIKATIKGNGIVNSVEFSMEEMLARHQGRPWGEMNQQQQQAALKDYALLLFSRQEGVTGDLQVTFEPGTFSDVEDGQV